MALLVGAVLALGVTILARVAGLDGDRAFYPTVTIVIASYYVLFALMGGSHRALAIESAVGAVLLSVAVAGFRSSLWLVVAALAAHGIFDFVPGPAIDSPGVPGWWPPFCLAYDITAAACLAASLKSRRLRAAA